jgi:hypothetical protein
LSKWVHMFFVFAAAAGAGMLCAGCGRDTPPEYSNLRLQLTRDVFRALADGNPGQVLNSLDRLRPMATETAFIELLAERERNHLVVQRVNAHLKSGDVAAAHAAAQAALRKNGASLTLSRILDVTGQLIWLDSYLAQQPYDSPDKAEQALLRTVKATPLLQSSTTFAGWLGSERRRIDQWREKERQQKVSELLGKLNTAVLTNPDRSDELIKELLAVAPGHRFAEIYRRMAGSNQPPDIRVPVGSDTEQREYLTAIELLACHYRQRLPKSVVQSLWTQLREVPAATDAGLMLRAMLAADAGEREEAAEFGKKLLAARPDVDERFITELAKAAVMTRE